VETLKGQRATEKGFDDTAKIPTSNALSTALTAEQNYKVNIDTAGGGGRDEEKKRKREGGRKKFA
jgi:hypothetical protein